MPSGLHTKTPDWSPFKRSKAEDWEPETHAEGTHKSQTQQLFVKSLTPTETPKWFQSQTQTGISGAFLRGPLYSDRLAAKLE